MTPTDVKELLKTLIAEEHLPIDVVDILPSEDLGPRNSTTEARIKDVISQWNKDGKSMCFRLGNPILWNSIRKPMHPRPPRNCWNS